MQRNPAVPLQNRCATPTRELSAAAFDLEELGYCIVTDAMDPLQT
eukprot:SAG31_NODE_23347_length_506_cov_0.877150_1_plen_44_part_10